jgi:hypothetical protein
VVLGVLKFNYRLVNQNLELMFPAVVKLVETLVSLNTIMNDTCYEVLSCLRIFLGHHAGALRSLLSVLLGLFVRRSTIGVGTKDSRR